jgi:ELWxxDGT repeat protein
LLTLGSAERSSNPSDFVRIVDSSYFVAEGAGNGRELWKTDASPVGTRLVRDIRLGSDDADVSQLVAVGSTLSFRADDGVHGRKLWMTDGSDGGTDMVAGLEELQPTASPGSLIAFSGRHFFRLGGADIWVTDGTDAGTRVAIPRSDHPRLLDGGDRLYLVGDTALHASGA